MIVVLIMFLFGNRLIEKIEPSNVWYLVALELLIDVTVIPPILSLILK